MTEIPGGYKPEQVEKAPELGKPDFDGFVRKVSETDIPIGLAWKLAFVRPTTIREAVQEHKQDYRERMQTLGGIKNYPRRLFTSIREGIANPNKSDDVYKKVASEMLGLDNVSASEARYAANYIEAISIAKAYLNQKEMASRGTERTLHRAEDLYNLLIKQEKKAIDASRIRPGDLTPQRIVELRNHVENQLNNPPNTQEK